MIGFRFVSEHQADYQVTALCRIAGVSRSSFYAWSTRAPSPRAQAAAVLLEDIREIHSQSRHTYGAPRIAGQLRRRGIRVSRHRVARLMRIIEVLRPPVETAQFTSWAFTRRALDSGLAHRWARSAGAGTAMILVCCSGRSDPCYDRLRALALTCRPPGAAHRSEAARQPSGQ